MTLFFISCQNIKHIAKYKDLEITLSTKEREPQNIVLIIKNNTKNDLWIQNAFLKFTEDGTTNLICDCFVVQDNNGNDAAYNGAWGYVFVFDRVEGNESEFYLLKKNETLEFVISDLPDHYNFDAPTEKIYVTYSGQLGESNTICFDISKK